MDELAIITALGLSSDLDALKRINTAVVRRINSLEFTPRSSFAPKTRSGATRADFRVGDRVTFNAGARGTITATVEKINPKSIGVLNVDPTARERRWRVSPGLLHLVGADRTSAAPTAPIIPAIPSATPTAAGAGAW